MKQVSDVRSENRKEEMDYSEYMETLRTQLPVADYMLKPQTTIVALAMMFSLALVYYLVLPFIMFQSLTVVAWLVFVALFLALTWTYYEYVYYPNEIVGTESSGEVAKTEEGSARGDGRGDEQ